ncbi:MAG: hypothetical protein LBE47_00425 [Methanomassiliicoccaceae archaeon]|jgi:hypothetical protein|nr:hypothetical protein [Methanomassiliicoccaceae archaeon]
MAWYEKGGVLTKKMITLAVMALLAVTVISMMPTALADEGDLKGTYADIRAESHLAGTGKTIDYKIFATDINGDSDKVSFTARLADSNGNTVGSVTPSSRSYVDDDGTTLTITAPGDPGTYVLNVVFTFTDNNGEKSTVTKTAPVRVVVPITLLATIDNTNGGVIVDMDVWFVVNGKVIEESKEANKNIRIEAGGTRTVTYDWVTEPLSNGKHTMYLEGTVGPLKADVPGLNEPQTFYVGQNSYTLVEAFVVILFIILLIVLIYIIRKPVKNVGKPKARRR